jgi:hypothetical protein
MAGKSSQESGVRSQNPEDRSQESGVRSQNPDSIQSAVAQNSDFCLLTPEFCLPYSSSWLLTADSYPPSSMGPA